MPWSIGGKGTHGCSGYPVVDYKGKVVGCHTTREQAARQQSALYASENIDKAKNPCWDGYTMEGMKPSSDGSGKMVPNCVPSKNKKSYNGCGCTECKAKNISCEECGCSTSDMSKKKKIWQGSAFQ